MRTNRLYGVLDRRLAEHVHLAGEAYSIADMATYPWVVPWKRQQQNLDEFPHLRRWFDAIRNRPATISAYERGEPYASRATVTEVGQETALRANRHRAPVDLTHFFGCHESNCHFAFEPASAVLLCRRGSWPVAYPKYGLPGGRSAPPGTPSGCLCG